MALKRWIAILTALAVLALPTMSLADHHKAGGEAAEHRSDKAAEKSNAQWDENNADRPEKDHGDHDGEDSKDKKEKKDNEDKKDKKEKKGKKDKKDK